MSALSLDVSLHTLSYSPLGGRTLSRDPIRLEA